MSHCADCPEIATHKCSVCKDTFCEGCAKRHLAFYDIPSNENMIITKIEEPTDAKTK